MENQNLYLLNKIIQAAINYDHTDNTLTPLSDAIFEYLDYFNFIYEYVIYVDDDMNIKIMHQKQEELPLETGKTAE